MNWLLLLVLISSCDSKNQDVPFEKNHPVNHDSIAADHPAGHINTSNSIESFESFLKKFNNDYVFQKSRVLFPLPLISSMDYEGIEYDTSAIILAEYVCIELTEPKSTIIEGKTYLRRNESASENVIILGVEDTGVHISYFFSLKENSWMLVKIVDEST